MAVAAEEVSLVSGAGPIRDRDACLEGAEPPTRTGAGCRIGAGTPHR